MPEENTYHPENLFNVLLPLALKGCGPAVKTVNGLLTIAVAGSGIWTLDLRREGDGLVRPGAAESPDLLMAMSHQAFQDFAAGDLDPTQVAEQGGVVVVGDIQVLRRFGNLFRKVSKAEGLQQPSGASVSLRGEHPKG